MRWTTATPLLLLILEPARASERCPVCREASVVDEITRDVRASNHYGNVAPRLARLLGIFSARDYGGPRRLTGKAWKRCITKDVTTSPMATMGPDVKITDGVQIMTSKNIRHLPLLEGDKLLGVVTLRTSRL